LSVGLGSLISQQLLEPRIHRGIEANWLVNIRMDY
jgi:hypothetical protein